MAEPEQPPSPEQPLPSGGSAISKGKEEEEEKMVIVICAVTGFQGEAIVDRLVQSSTTTSATTSTSSKKMEIRGLTRDGNGPKAQALIAQHPEDIFTLIQVDYSSRKSLRRAFQGAHSLYLNCPMAMTGHDPQGYQRLIDCAIQAGIRHIVYSSLLQLPHSSEQNNEDSIPPHWTSARHTEGYLAIRQDETKLAFDYHVLRLAPHFNDTLQLKYDNNANTSASDNNGVTWIAYPWPPSIRTPTVSAKDVARIAVALLLQPDRLPNGAVVPVATDYANPHEMAQYMTLAIANANDTNKDTSIIQAHQPILLKPHAMLSYEQQCLVAMGDYLAQQQSQFGIVKDDWGKKQTKHKYKLQDILLQQQSQDSEEPLETVQAFVQRVFGAGQTK